MIIIKSTVLLHNLTWFNCHRICLTNLLHISNQNSFHIPTKICWKFNQALVQQVFKSISKRNLLSNLIWAPLNIRMFGLWFFVNKLLCYRIKIRSFVIKIMFDILHSPFQTFNTFGKSPISSDALWYIFWLKLWKEFLCTFTACMSFTAPK